MTELLTAAQMRAIEQAAIASGEVTGLELMERAGRGVVEAIFEEWPELRATSHRAVVLCGPGNNGGDGFVVARLLKDWGWEVEVFLYGEPERIPPDARVNYERWRGMGEVLPISNAYDAFMRFHDDFRPDIWIDGLFGTGLTRPVPVEVGTLLDHVRLSFSELIADSGGKVVALDLPSGIGSDTGEALFERGQPTEALVFSADGHHVDRNFRARYQPLTCDLTVTFHSEKLGHRVGGGPGCCGRIVVADIGLKSFARGVASLVNFTREPSRLDKRWAQSGDTHKYSHGHALILSGPPGHTGAARLAARGALRIGAGVVTVAAPPDAIPEHAAQLDAIMLRPVPDADSLTEALADPRITALCLGPGLGIDERARGLVAPALESRGGPRPTDAVGRGLPRLATVLDADALTLLSRDPDLFAALHENCILTPHAGEFARLFPDIAAKLEAPATTGPAYSKVDATREAAKRAGCVVLYKGPDTVIADPAGRCSINSAHYDRAAPWLATAGSGDVLSGFIAGLLARGFAPMQAAETAAWLHVECARKFGPGLIAEDLPEQLPAVFRDLGL